MREVNGLAVPTTLDELLRPEAVALVVYDMQVGICSQIEGGDQIIAQVGKVLAAARSAGVRTFFTRHLSLPRELMGIMQYRTAMVWQRTDDPATIRPWFLRDAPGTAVVPDLAPRPSEGIVDKITLSAFEGTYLAIALRDCGIRAVVLCGIATEIGIDPSARHAVDLGLVPIVVRDACGHGNAAAAARTFEALTFLGDIVVSDVASVTAAWGGGARARQSA